VVGVRIGEQQVELVRAELARNSLPFLFDLARELTVALRQLLQLDDVASAPLETVPRRDEVAVLGRLSGKLPGSSRVVPRAGLGQLGV
jgi:hypothetical protein